MLHGTTDVERIPSFCVGVPGLSSLLGLTFRLRDQLAFPGLIFV